MLLKIRRAVRDQIVVLTTVPVDGAGLARPAPSTGVGVVYAVLLVPQPAVIDSITGSTCSCSSADSGAEPAASAAAV